MSKHYHMSECIKCHTVYRKNHHYKLQAPTTTYWSNSIIGLFFQIITNRIYNLFKDVLLANKECSSATLEVSNEGLARITFKVDDYDSTYYVVATQGVD